MIEPAQRRILGSVVRSLREQAPRRTRAELARACHVSESQLRNIENGLRSPSPETLEELERELGTGGLLFDLVSRGRSGMRRRLILQSLALLGAIIPDIDNEAPGVGPPQIDAIRSMTMALRDLDNQHGGVHAHHSVAAYLDNVALPMLRDARGALSSDLHSAVAELALLAGWSAFDAGIHDTARAHFRRALTLAERAGNRPLLCETIIATSNQAAILRDGKLAVDAASAALDLAADMANPALTGEARMAVAHGLSLQGDTSAVARAVVRAHQDIDRADRPDAPEWIKHLGHAWMDGRVAQCMHLLNDRPNAVDAAVRAAQIPRQLPRGRALNAGHTALVMFAANRPEEACIYARQVIADAAQVRSARVDEYLRRLEVAASAFTLGSTDELLASLSSAS